MKPMQFDTSRSYIGRLYFLQFCVLVMSICLGAAMFWRQCFERHRFDFMSQRQSLRRVLYPGLRGCIYDRNGFLLAGNRDTYCLYADLNAFHKKLAQFDKKGNDNEGRAEQLWAMVHDALLPYAKVVGPIPFTISKKSLYLHYQQNSLLQVAVAKDISADMYAKLVENLPADCPFQVGIEKTRYYPNGATACHVLGYVTQTKDLSQDAVPGNDLRTFFLPKQKGRTGVEAYYDSQLCGLNGGDIWRVTPAGQEQSCLISVPSIDGKDLHLTLDLPLQQVCEQALGNHRGAVIILSVDTGAVRALVSKPDFDLNRLVPYVSNKTFKEITEAGAWFNRAIQGLYPPGSTFKVVTLSALMRAGIVNKQSRIECVGTYRIGPRDFHCHKRMGHGWVDLAHAIPYSCNPFFYHYAIKGGPSIIHHEACLLGIDKPTGIDLPYETKHMLAPSPDWKNRRLQEPWTDGDTANFSIGQGFLRVSPLQMACVAASFARNQQFCTPHLNQALPVNTSNPNKPLLEERDWELLIRGMKEVGKSRFLRIEGLSMAAKTGTSQVQIAGTNRFTHVGWSIGFVPLENPKIAFCVMVEEEEGDTGEFWGSHVCGPVIQEILPACLAKQFCEP